jgi:shikimate kinase
VGLRCCPDAREEDIFLALVDEQSADARSLEDIVVSIQVVDVQQDALGFGLVGDEHVDFLAGRRPDASLDGLGDAPIEGLSTVEVLDGDAVIPEFDTQRGGWYVVAGAHTHFFSGTVKNAAFRGRTDSTPVPAAISTEVSTPGGQARTMEGRARAPAAGTVLNALANETGAAFAIDEYTTATVELDPEASDVTGTVAGNPDADTRLVERCVAAVTGRFGDGEGGTVHTESEVPMASGLKSSSAAANATVLATLAALDATGETDRADACRLGVDVAREVGVTVTGAFDDASASMLGGVTVTDNATDELLAREERDWDVLVWTPPERAYSADADVDRCRQVTPMADLVADLALEGEFGRAMTVNGLAFAGALGFDADPMVEAMPHVHGVSLSGTGPSFVAVGERESLEAVQAVWSERPGRTWLTTTQTEGTTAVSQQGTR